jgi:5-methylthioribose kinase
VTFGAPAAAEQPDPSVTAFVRQSGLVRADSALSFQVLAGGVSSDIWLVSADRERFCVKRALPALRVAADWQVPVVRNLFEAAWFRTIGAFMPESVPKVLYEDKEQAMFAMEYLPPQTYRNWKAMLAHGEVAPAIAADVGARLSRIHGQTAAQAGRMRRDFATGEIFHAIRIEPYLLATAQAHPDLAEKLRALAHTTATTKRALVHGDVSPKNILIGSHAPVFIDAECAWFGDPAFDLCFCLNHLLLKCVLVPAKTGALLDSFRAMSAAYLRGVVWEDAHAFERRAADLLPGLFLARVDGKSPAEYITTESQRSLVRHTAWRLLMDDAPKRLADIAEAWALAAERLAEPCQ